MPSITFVQFGGAAQKVDAQCGITLMEVARANGVRGIDADCGGACACATCRVSLAPDWLALVGPSRGSERDLLECMEDFSENMRLSCQILVTENLDGLIATTPERQ